MIANCKRCIEFWEGDDGRLSMTRLTMLMAFFPATYVLVINATSLNITEILAVYLGAFVVSYVGGKTADNFGARNARRRMERDK